MISILIIDDDAATRARLREQLEAKGDIRVVAEAEDPIVARRLLDRVTPDVITLDLLMPRMDGLTFLKKLMAGRPMPVVVVSTVTREDAPACFEAISSGAVGVVGKVTLPHPRLWQRFGRELRDHVRAAAVSATGQLGSHRAGAPVAAVDHAGKLRPVVIGASTGGTEALLSLLSRLPEQSPPIAIVQHMPAGFTAPFAARLNEHCAILVKEAVDGEPLAPGTALVAPGYVHLEIAGSRREPIARLLEGKRVNFHRPAVDCLFHSATRIFGSEVVGVLLTGMGDDGARGLAAMHDAGAFTIGQDEATCVVYGMPAVAADLGACSTVASLDAIPSLLLQAATGRPLAVV